MKLSKKFIRYCQNDFHYELSEEQLEDNTWEFDKNPYYKEKDCYTMHNDDGCWIEVPGRYLSINSGNITFIYNPEEDSIPKYNIGDVLIYHMDPDYGDDPTIDYEFIVDDVRVDDNGEVRYYSKKNFLYEFDVIRKKDVIAELTEKAHKNNPYEPESRNWEVFNEGFLAAYKYEKTDKTTL